MYFVTYTSVRQQLADEGARSALAQQHRQGRDRLLGAEQRALQILEVARAADAQVTTMRRASNERARLQLLEANTRATILPDEGQESWRPMLEAATFECSAEARTQATSA